MSKKWTLPALILLLGSTAALQANPLDSPDIVYIDGLPCNRACQSYLAWSDRALSGRHRAGREAPVVVPAAAENERPEFVAPVRAAKRAATDSRTAPHAGKAASKDSAVASKTPGSKKIAAPVGAPAAPAQELAAPAAVPPQRPVDGIAAAMPQPAEAASSEVKPEVALPPPATLDVAAMSAAPASGTASNKADSKISSASYDDGDNLVALILARPEINSLSDLNNKSIAITENQSASSGRVSAALMAAGAADVQFSEVKASAIERVISGEVPAAVLLASREVADLFPELAGLRTFRVPLVQKARL